MKLEYWEQIEDRRVVRKKIGDFIDALQDLDIFNYEILDPLEVDLQTYHEEKLV